MRMRDIVLNMMKECAEIEGVKLASDLTDEAVLLNTGLDSMGFATLVVRLEQEVGIDPFTMTNEVIYPQTIGEFVKLYEDAAE